MMLTVICIRKENMCLSCCYLSRLFYMWTVNTYHTKTWYVSGLF